jgi:hypothetical protein
MFSRANAVPLHQTGGMDEPSGKHDGKKQGKESEKRITGLVAIARRASVQGLNLGLKPGGKNLLELLSTWSVRLHRPPGNLGLQPSTGTPGKEPDWILGTVRCSRLELQLSHVLSNHNLAWHTRTDA